MIGVKKDNNRDIQNRNQLENNNKLDSDINNLENT